MEVKANVTRNKRHNDFEKNCIKKKTEAASKRNKSTGLPIVKRHTTNGTTMTTPRRITLLPVSNSDDETNLVGHTSEDIPAGSLLGCHTDDDGRFQLEVLPPNPHRFESEEVCEWMQGLNADVPVTGEATAEQTS